MKTLEKNREFVDMRKLNIKKIAKYQFQYIGSANVNEAFSSGIITGAEWADDNPNWIRLIDEMPPIGVNVLTRVIKGDGSVVYQVDRRTSYEWVNLCHYDKITHWMSIKFNEE